MNHERKESKLWFGLFCVSFVIMVISVAALLWQYVKKTAANEHFKELQSEANACVEEESAAPFLNAQLEAEQAEIVEYAEQEETPVIPEKTDMRIDQKRREDQKAVQENAVSLEKAEGVKEEVGQETEQAVGVPEKTLDWEALRSQNPDIYAWIYVPDTTVDYPVVQHPTDNSYYLDHNLDGSKGYPGCIYSENFNHRDFSDIHTVLYGHNLKDKTMFSTLHNFEDPQLLQNAHYIYLYTEEAVFVYQIFAVYEFSAIHLLDNFDYTNEYVYEDLLKQIRQAAGNISQDVEVTAADRIITLSTCTADHDAARRFLVTGVLVN